MINNISFEFIRFVIHFNDDQVLGFSKKGKAIFYDDYIEVKVEISPSLLERRIIYKSNIRYFELIEEFD